MAGFIMQVQSAIFLLYVRWNPDSPRIVWDVVSIRTGLARMPVELRRGEPNTPLAFQRRDACHLKQQAGHGKIIVGIGQSTKDSISWIADYDNLYFAYSSAEEQIRTLIKLLFRGAVAFGAKTYQRYPSISKRKIITKAYGFIRQDIVQFNTITVGYDVDFVSPIFEHGLPCL